MKSKGEAGSSGVRFNAQHLFFDAFFPQPGYQMLINTFFFKLWRKDGRQVSLLHPSAPGFHLRSAKYQKTQVKNISRS